MAFIKRTITNRVSSTDDQFTIEDIEGSQYKRLTQNPSGITQQGTLINADLLQRYEDNLNYLANLTQITWSELKTLRDNGNLIPNSLYRITDYVCTTTQTDTSSASNQFDIIVFSLSENTLSEIARAILHSGDTYFANSKLEAWELKYCLDNDTNRFAWADSTNGKGVIFYMKDENGNECPYDFKNIQFKRKLTNGKLDTTSGTDTWCYTFNVWNSSTCKDLSVVQSGKTCYGNKIGVYVDSNKYMLNDNVFLNTSLTSICNYNTFGNYCYANTFGSNCYYNTFGNYCQSNTFGNICNSNTFGNGYYSNTFGNSCQYNTFGSNCNYNTFGNYCYYNTFGNDCYSNTFGNSCQYNTFGNDCYSNKLVATGNTGYARYNIFENGVQYVDLQADSASTSSSNSLQNITIRQGIVGTSSSYKTITETRNLAYDTTYRATGHQDKTI